MATKQTMISRVSICGYIFLLLFGWQGGVEAGTIANADIRGDTDGYFFLKDTTCGSCCAQVTVDTPVAGTFSVYNATETYLGPTAVTIGEQSIVMQCSIFHASTPGMYTVTMKIDDGAGNTHEEQMIAVVEEACQGYTVTPSHRYSTPGELITFDMEVTHGTNMLFTVDCITNIQLMKSCDGDTKTATYSQHFNDTGNFVITTMASNYGSKCSQEVVLTVIYALNGITFTVDDVKPQTNEDPNIKVKMDAGADTPMGNLTAVYECDGQQTVELSSLTTGGEQHLPCACTTQGNKTITVTVSTELNNVTDVFDVYCWDILNITLRLDKDVQPKDSVIPFIFEDMPFSGFQYDIDFCQGFTLSNTNPTVYESPYVPIDTSSIIYPNIGNCTVHATFWNEMYIVVLDLSFEISIGVTDLTVEPSALELLTGETFTLTVNATGPDIFWAADFVEAMVVQDGCSGMTAAHNFTAAGTYTVEVMASNAVNSLNDTLVVVVANPINGFTVSSTTTRVDASANVVVDVALDAGALVPMGNLTITISPCGASDLTEFLDVAAGAATTKTCVFAIQGNYTLDITIASSVSSENYTIEVAVCDQLSVGISTTKTDWAVGENIPVALNSPPVAGFKYNIDMGDGSTVHADENDNILLAANAYTAIPDIAYGAPGTKTIQFLGYNQCFSVSQSISLEVQYGIPNSTLELSPGRTNVSPDDETTLSLTTVSGTGDNNPTDVECTWDLDDGITETNLPVTMDFTTSVGYVIATNYTTAGTKSYTVACSNLVSSFSFAGTVDVVVVEASAFTISFDPDTLMDEGSCTTFTVTLAFHDITFVPAGVTYVVDYDDGAGATAETDLTSYTISKQLCTRGQFAGSLTVKYDGVDNVNPMNYDLGTCNMVLTSAQAMGLVGSDSFDFDIINFLTETISVAVDWKDGSAVQTFSVNSGATLPVSHTFLTNGPKIPSYTSTSSLGTDGAALATELLLMNPVQDLELELPPRVLLGIALDPTIVYTGSVSLLNLTCVFTFDATNEETVTEIDFIPGSSVTYIGPSYAYMAIQTETLMIDCSNALTNQVLNATFEVASDCFLAPDIFEAIHRRIETPMRIYRSNVPVTLTARVSLADKCKNTTDAEMRWRWEKRGLDFVTFSDYPVDAPAAMSMDITSEIDEGFYRVEFYMRLLERENDYVVDSQYMQIINPPLVCLIQGGDWVRLGRGQTLVLNAYFTSYDPVIGVNKESGLDFSWACYVEDCGVAMDYTLPLTSNKGYQSKPECTGITLTDTGEIELDTSPLPAGSCYVFEVTVSKDSRNASDIQIAEVMVTPPCKVAIICIHNCMEKLTPEEPTSFSADIICDGATQEQLDAAVYDWKIFQFDTVNQDFNEIVNWDASFLRDKGDKQFQLTPGYFNYGDSFRLQVTVVAASKPEGIALKTLVVNEPPYGGSCSLAPLHGIFLNATFTLECDNWKDEGIRNSRSADDNNEPLKVEIYQDSRLISKNEFTKLLSVASVDLGCGQQENNFETLVEVIIIDIFNAQVVHNWTVTIENSVPPVPGFLTTTSSSANAASNLTEEEKAEQDKVFNDYLDSIVDTVSLSDSNGAALTTASNAMMFASALSTLNFPEVTDDNINNVTAENRVEEVGKTLDEVTSFADTYQQKVMDTYGVITSALGNSIETFFEVNKNASTTPPMDKISTFASSFSTTLSNPDNLPVSSLEDSGNTLLLLTSAMSASANQSQCISCALKMAQDVGSLWDSVAKINNNFGVPGVEMESDDIFGDGIVPEGLNFLEADFLKSVIKRKKEIKLKLATPTINKTNRQLLQAAADIYALLETLTTEGGMEQISKQSYTLSQEKDKASTILNGTGKIKEVEGSELQLGGVDGLDDPNDIIEKKFTVVKDSPFVTGTKAKLVEHPVTMAGMSRYGKKLQMRAAEIAMRDPYEAGFDFYPDPTIDPEDPGFRLYHPFIYRDRSEQVCVTVKPLDIDICYDVCFRALVPPNDAHFDHCIFNVTGNVGIEYCAPAGVCKRSGTCWMSIHPVYCHGAVSADDATRAERRKRAAASPAAVSGEFVAPDNVTVPVNPLLSAYWLRIITLSCLSWDGSEEDWKSDNCEVKRDPANNKTRCLCGDQSDLITSVSFFVAPNTIDFSTVFLKFDIAGQGAVLGTILVVFVLFVFFLFWARYMDGQDVLQWGVTLLADNFQEDDYFYLITVHTGMVRHGGTKSRVGFCLAGEDDDTGVRELSDGVREELKAGSTMHFLMATPKCLGTLQCFRVWHDNSGKGDSASWYLNRIEVTDLQNSQKYDFLCYQWMSLEEGTLDRALALSSTENMKNFKTMFFEHARHHVTDDHLWVSVMLRPVKSHFSRVQRVGCCYALLMLAMIANAMFFQSKSQKDRVQTGDIEIGPISFSLSQIYISFVSTIITAVPVFFIMLLFRKSKLSHKATTDGVRLWMPKCFRGFKFYKQAKAIERVLCVRDIVDDVDGVLPHFCVYISWVFAFVCVFVSAFFIMLYSMEWGKDISEEWLVTFILSFFESLVLLDPVKVLVLAVLFAILLKTLKASRPTHFDLEHIGRMNRNNGSPSIGRQRLDYKSPFSEEEMKRAQLRCRRRNTMRKAIQELLTNSFFLVLLASISYSNRDPHGWFFHRNLNNVFLEPFRPAITFANANTTEDYFVWLRETAIPHLFPEQDFDDSPLDGNLRLRMSDLANYRVGAPRLRQVRTGKKTCTYPYVGHTTCYPSYDIGTEEHGTFCQGWNGQPPCPDYQALAVTNQAWTFVSALDIWGLPITGQHNMYGGGGYIAELDISRQVAVMSYDELLAHRWIDRHTRAVFLEFTLYNGNKNIFCYVSLLSEFPESGGVLEFKNIYPFRSFNHVGTVGKYILACEIVFFVFTLVWLGFIVFRLLKDRWAFFKSFWNVVEFLSVVISFVAIVLYFVRLNYTNQAMERFRENDRLFVNFYHIAVWDSMFVYVLGFLLCIATLRLLKVMGYSRVTQMVYLVLKESSKTLPGFFFYIILILAAYGLLGLILFGKNAYNYKDIITTMETLFAAVLGHAGFRNMEVPVAEGWISLIYFVSFIMIVVFTLSNIFMTILLDVMNMVEDDPKNLNYKEIELFKYMWDSAKTLISGKKQNDSLDTKQALKDAKDNPFNMAAFATFASDPSDKNMEMKMHLAAAITKATNKPVYGDTKY